MMLLIFAWMLIGSAFIVGGWFHQGWRRRLPLSFYNAGLMMAVGLDCSSAGMVLTTYGRIEQILRDSASFATDDPLWYLGAALMIAGKSCLIWVAAMGEGRSYSRRFWWGYWAAMAAAAPAAWMLAPIF